MLSKYQISEKSLGKGAYGEVFVAKNTLTEETVAIKKIKQFCGNSADAQATMRELTILRILKNHPNIVHLDHVEMSKTTQGKYPTDIYLVFKHYETDLDNVINSSQSLSVGHLQFILYQILCGLHYIHSAKIVHRDLKPANILIARDCKIAICDFGLSRSSAILHETSHDTHVEPFHHFSNYVVTRYYRSPELILNAYKSHEMAAIDIWSVGCILASLLLRYPLFRGDTALKVLFSIHQIIGIPIEWLNSIHQEISFSCEPGVLFEKKFQDKDPVALNLLTQLLEVNPSKRISATDALTHSFFSSHYNAENILTFDIASLSTLDKHCLNNYYQLEKRLDVTEFAPMRSQRETLNSIYECILHETMQYHPEPNVFNVTTLSSTPVSESELELESTSAAIPVIPSTRSPILFFSGHAEQDVMETTSQQRAKRPQQNTCK